MSCEVQDSKNKKERQTEENTDMTEFELIFSAKIDDVLPVSKYKSISTGITLCLAEVDGPVVNGYLCLATETHDDDGLPHTLEHLVFMGSEKYPYKGVLDQLVNRCLASGTNAWTDVDHTCYTVVTAGGEGFCNLLPIYLDHVLYPLLTESAYVAEVHHINESGEDAGVVYCEEQATQNTGENRTHEEMMRDMYPAPCGYSANYGGKVENLRESTSNYKVHQYHKKFYRPENICIIITGQVKVDEVIKAIMPIIEKVKEKMSSGWYSECGEYTRPWQDPVPPLARSVDRTVKFPADDDDQGIVLVSWRGPPAKETYVVSSLMVLLEYLTDTPVSPLQKAYVECEQAVCSKVKYSIAENSVTCFYVAFENVQSEYLHTVNTKLFKVLRKLVEEPDKFDMGRMEAVIQKRVLDCLDHIEDNPHDTVAFYIIGHFLYGDDKQDLSNRVNPKRHFESMKAESKEYWLGLVKRYCLDVPSVTIVGEASQQLQLEMGLEEKQRIEAQLQSLGAQGLKRVADELMKAKKHNEVLAPSEMLSSVPVPSTSSISWHRILPSNNHCLTSPAHTRP